MPPGTPIERGLAGRSVSRRQPVNLTGKPCGVRGDLSGGAQQKCQQRAFPVKLNHSASRRAFVGEVRFNSQTDVDGSTNALLARNLQAADQLDCISGRVLPSPRSHQQWHRQFQAVDELGKAWVREKGIEQRKTRCEPEHFVIPEPEGRFQPIKSSIGVA